IGGFAHRTAGKIAIGSDTKGKLSSVSVKANATFGFTADVSASGNTIPANDVGNLNKVTADEINGLLAAASIPVHASFSANLGKLVLTTNATGADKTLAVNAGPAQGALGLDTTSASGADGATNTFYVKHGTTWKDSGGTSLNLAGLKPEDTPSSQPA